MEDLKNQIILLQSYNQSLQNQLESCKKELATYFKYLDVFNSYDQTVNQLESVRNVNSQINSAFFNRDKEMFRLLNIQKQFRSLKDKLQQQISKREHFQSLYSRSQQIIAEKEQKLKEVEIELRQKQKELRGVAGCELIQLKRVIGEKTNQIELLKDKNKEISQEKDALQLNLMQKMKILEQDKVRAQNEIKSREIMSRKISQLTLELQQTVMLLQEERKFRDKDKQAVSTQNSLNQEEMQTREELFQRIQEYKDLLRKEQQKNEKLGQKLKSINTKESASKDYLLKQSLQKYKHLSKSHEESVLKYESEIKILKDEIMIAEGVKKGLEQNLKQLEKKSNQKEMNLRDQNQQLEKKIQKLEEKMSTQVLQKTTKNEWILAKQNELNGLKQTVLDQEKTISDMKVSLDYYKALNQSQMMQIQALESSNGLLKKQIINTMGSEEQSRRQLLLFKKQKQLSLSQVKKSDIYLSSAVMKENQIAATRDVQKIKNFVKSGFANQSSKKRKANRSSTYFDKMDFKSKIECPMSPNSSQCSAFGMI